MGEVEWVLRIRRYGDLIVGNMRTLLTDPHVWANNNLHILAAYGISDCDCCDTGTQIL